MIDGLFDWFKINGIAYPWGENPDPYRVWISEIMLQQTVITSVIPYFKKWLLRFPDLSALTEADEDTVLRQWEGLGYYSRAVNILKTAHLLTKQYSGQWPDKLEELVKLPGVGSYTAAAIASFAFGADIPVFDANVRRILCRFNALKIWPSNGDKKMSELLSDNLKTGEYGLWNSAIMQLGQLVCKNSAPVCNKCPFCGDCKAFKDKKTVLYPEKRTKKVRLLETELLILVCKGEVLLVKRDKGIGKGLWFIPPREWFAGYSLTGREIQLGKFVHTYTDHKEKLTVSLLLLDNRPEWDEINPEWIPFERLDKLPMAAIYRKIVQKIPDLIQ